MSRHSDRPTRSHHQQQHSTVAKQVTSSSSSSRARRSIEQQLKLEQRAALKASFGGNASQLKLIIYILLAVALSLTAFAFFSSHWLEVERRFYGSKFRKLGLWRMCFNSFSAPDDYQFKKFYVGCRWIFADEYKPIRRFLLPAFFISTQVLYTAGFLLLVLVCAGIVAVQQCFIIEREDYALRALSVASLLSAISCTSAVTIFAIYADRDDWMPDPEHNYLSWSFAAALIGSVLLWVSALLFYIEMRLTIVRDSV
uniref:Uncharacterized protein n=1 Tax=Aceria tosichella TaxID=561515 RepID=A0A6G1S926_9ACAR